MLTIVGIGTEIGKTIVSAILVEALEADYWKPVQSGSVEQTDTQTVQSLVSPLVTRTFHPEAYKFEAPVSPHFAAQLEGVEIVPAQIALPATTRPLIIELAGGLLVPLTPNFLNRHLVRQLGLPVILVANYYLGSINHTLLTAEVLDKYDIPVAGIIFNGQSNPATKKVILDYTGIPLLGEIPFYERLTPQIIQAEAAKIKQNLINYNVCERKNK